MKKYVCFLLLMCSTLFLMSCSASVPTENTIALDSKGHVTCTIVEEFDRDYYDEEELETEIGEEIANYNVNFASDHMEMKSFAVKDGVATLQLKFDEAQYYADYSGHTFYAGSAAEAEAAGYTLPESLTDADGNSAAPEELNGWENAKLIVTDEAVAVKTPGEILAVSEDVTITAKKAAAVQDAQLAYIIYK